MGITPLPHISLFPTVDHSSSSSVTECGGQLKNKKPPSSDIGNLINDSHSVLEKTTVLEDVPTHG